MGAEAAFNTLDADLSLFLLGANDFRQRIDLPIDQATVEESARILCEGWEAGIERGADRCRPEL